ncbi:hypothetical protein JQV19_08520 [Sulfitobacter mediterraneus]|uniref:DUF6948 domain-containing protein n=1 Tax=Sulfitobacter mediterraneus TaxID=83219 RepID=UPI00193AA261|nr:hypothetical protein [Sulfitobacter mediterraneus]MBM1556690.1 hypothetical protein [Sulfitobacter mediterraneus]MBM1570113.1 hypothetical protein [Sulfitobacter mediterraneus]MBM1574070.1 hypothetical protein [Sulfitobacter mediterraneus]MBM1577855.1 hypothetical protein [Sulfitobacter mediterraneus]MBM1579648.1 hypothetical protein [Sulfitobacter mediterraneus]
MDANQLAQVIVALTGAQNAQPGVAGSMIGKYAIIRSRNEGINAGEIAAADETGVVLKNARRIWYHRPADKSESWYEGVANHGLSDDSKVSGAVSQKAIIEGYSVTICTDVARQSIEAAVAHAQS